MNQRSICLFLAIKGLSAQAVHNHHGIVLGPDAIAYRTVTQGLPQRQFPSVPCNPSEEPPNTVIENAILGALEKQRFSFIRERGKFICIPTTPVH
jgi:hypothetical protein